MEQGICISPLLQALSVSLAVDAQWASVKTIPPDGSGLNVGGGVSDGDGDPDADPLAEEVSDCVLVGEGVCVGVGVSDGGGGGGCSGVELPPPISLLLRGPEKNAKSKDSCRP